MKISASRRFAKILAEAGFAPMQAKPCCITHLADLIDRFKPRYRILRPPTIFPRRERALPKAA